jgi:hypothetical protein
MAHAPAHYTKSKTTYQGAVAPDTAINLSHLAGRPNQNRWKNIFKIKRTSSSNTNAMNGNNTGALSDQGNPAHTNQNFAHQSDDIAGESGKLKSSSDTQAGPISVDNIASGDGSMSSVHLPLTPNPISPMNDQEYPHYSTSTDRSSGSSGVLNHSGSPLSNSAKGRFQFAAPSNHPSDLKLDTTALRVKVEKKDKYRTLGRMGSGGIKGSKPIPMFDSGNGVHDGMRVGTTPSVHMPTNDQSPTISAAQRFIRRVASAPNAKGLFSSSSAIPRPPNGSMPGPVPSDQTIQPVPTGLEGGVAGSAVFESRSRNLPSPLLSSSLQMQDDPTSSVNSYCLAGSSVSLASTSANTSAGSPNHQTTARDHRAQSVGQSSKSAYAGGRLGIASGPSFRRTYSSNSIKSKTVGFISLVITMPSNSSEFLVVG